MKPKNKGGRPSKKDSIDLNILKLLCSKGFTDDEMARTLGVCRATISNYKSDPKFLDTLKEGKDQYDNRIVRSLAERAMGYTVKETTREVTLNDMQKGRHSSKDYKLTPEQWENALKIFENKCAYCGAEGDLTKDHVVPLDKGGKYEVSNIIPCCQLCNSSKGTEEMGIWFRKQDCYSSDTLARIANYLVIVGTISSKELSLNITKVVEKQLPPDPTSMIFWLKNRRPEEWRDKTDVDLNVVDIKQALTAARKRTKKDKT